MLALFVVVFIAISVACYKLYHELALYRNPTLQSAQVRRDTDQLLQKVGALIILPTGEVPIVGTVEDEKTLAARQAFYKDAKNGDRLLIYVAAQKAILYSPSRNIIVNVGPFISSDARADTGVATSSSRQSQPRNK